VTAAAAAVVVQPSSSGGGGSGGSPEPASNVEAKEFSQAFITSRNPVKFDFPRNATCVVYVIFDAKRTVGKTIATVEMLKGKSTLVSGLPSDEVYKFLNIWVGNSGYGTENNIENAVVCFKVEKSWLQNKNIDQSSITLTGTMIQNGILFRSTCQGKMTSTCISQPKPRDSLPLQ